MKLSIFQNAYLQNIPGNFLQNFSGFSRIPDKLNIVINIVKICQNSMKILEIQLEDLEILLEDLVSARF